jgi:hypothetical protein
MDASRLMAMLVAYLRDHEDLPAPIYKLGQILKDVSNVNLLMTDVEILDRLEYASSNEFPPSWLRMLAHVGGSGLHGRQLARRIRSILEQQYRKEHKGALLEGVYHDLQPFVSNAKALLTSLDRMQIKPDDVPDGKCEIGVLFPSSTLKTLEDLTRESHEFDRHLRVLVELTGGSGSVLIKRLETGSFNIYTLANPSVGALFAAMVAGLVALWKQVAEIRKLAAETEKINLEIAEKLKAQANELRQAGVDKLATDCLATTVESNDARRNELTVSFSQALAYLDTKIQMNVIFEVRAAGINAGESTPELEAALKSIRSNGAILADAALCDLQRLLPVGSAPDNEPGA